MKTTSARAPNAPGREPDAVHLPRTTVDVALIQLVRLVLDDTWSAEEAAKSLLDHVEGDLRVLRRARARVVCGATERFTESTVRALLALDCALATGREP